MTSFYPLNAYVYGEGLARFASEEYSTDSNSFNCRMSHLTNYSINKHNKKYVKYVLYFLNFSRNSEFYAIDSFHFLFSFSGKFIREQI